MVLRRELSLKRNSRNSISNIRGRSSSHQSLIIKPQSSRENIERTLLELREDFYHSRALYYINGREVFLNRHSIRTFDADVTRAKLNLDLKSMLLDADGDVVEFIKNHFNSQGFKAIARNAMKSANSKINYDDYDCEALRYDFIVNDDRSVTFVKRFQLGKSYLCEHSSKISKEGEIVLVKPIRQLTIPIKSVNHRYSPETIASENIIFADNKSVKKIEDQMDKGLSIFGIMSASPSRDNRWRWLQGFASVFYRIYPADSYVPGSGLFNHRSIKKIPGTQEALPKKHVKRMERALERYSLHPVTMLAAFLGFPNKLALNEKPSMKKIIRNMLVWDKNNKSSISNVFLFPVILGWSLIKFIFLAPYNILRLGTELLPALLADYCYSQAAVSRNPWFANSFGLMFDGIYCLGRAITSPLDSMLAARDFAVNFRKSEKEHWGWSVARIIAGTLLMLLSASVTATVYTFLLPYVFNVFFAMGPDIAAVAMQVSEVLTPFLSGMGMVGVLAMAMVVKQFRNIYRDWSNETVVIEPVRKVADVENEASIQKLLAQNPPQNNVAPEQVPEQVPELKKQESEEQVVVELTSSIGPMFSNTRDKIFSDSEEEQLANKSVSEVSLQLG